MIKAEATAQRYNKITTQQEFLKIFKFDGKVAIDRATGKQYFCPKDLGVDLNMEFCSKSNCDNCWENYISELEQFEVGPGEKLWFL